MKADYHVHIDKLIWSSDTIERIAWAAQRAELDRVGLVVHTKILQGFQPLYYHIMSDGETHKKLKFNKSIEDYVNLVQESKDKGLPVSLGIEVCYSNEGESFLRYKLNQYPFDYKIGSVHMIYNMHYKTAVERYKDTEMVGRMYYQLVLNAIESGLFDIIGHIEVVRREDLPGLDFYPEMLDKICTSLVKNNCAIEINTKWLVKHDSIVPGLNTLKYMKDKGVRIVFGSDAHHIERIGFGREIALKAVEDAGYDGFHCL